MIAKTPQPPYYAVIFTSILKDDHSNYEEEANEVLTLAITQPGFLGVESARDGVGITVSYWDSIEAIRAWGRNARHQEAKEKGKKSFYEVYKTRISKVEREY
jgi:heme-degrading monooxygenase HmoA